MDIYIYISVFNFTFLLKKELYYIYRQITLVRIIFFLNFHISIYNHSPITNDMILQYTLNLPMRIRNVRQEQPTLQQQGKLHRRGLNTGGTLVLYLSPSQLDCTITNMLFGVVPSQIISKRLAFIRSLCIIPRKHLNNLKF